MVGAGVAELVAPGLKVMWTLDWRYEMEKGSKVTPVHVHVVRGSGVAVGWPR